MSTIPDEGCEIHVKTCPTCKLTKPAEQFDLRMRSNGKVREAKRLHSSCRHCRNINYSNHIIKKRYGITREQYWEILHSQNGTCALCHKQCDTGKNLAVDHDHSSGKVRGLLCMRCNRAVGLLRDSAEAALNLYKYLKGE